MALTASQRKVGRPGSVATHPRWPEIEALLAPGVPARQAAERFNVSRSAVYRFWGALPKQYRARIVNEAASVAERRMRIVAAELAVISERHPAARPDIEALACRLLSPPPIGPGSN